MSNLFAKQALQYQRRLARSCESLHGLAAGMLADGQISAEEARFLDLWLKENDEIAHQWPGSILADRLRTILSDGVITADELSHLKQTLSDLIGDRLRDTGALGHSTRLPVDDSSPVVLAGRSFCVTGDFIYGPRSKVLSAIEARGGLVRNSVRLDLHYLVIGYMVSPNWKHESYGTKILKAVEYQTRGRGLTIVSEEHWARHL